MVLLTITWPILRTRNSCGSGGNPRNASILPSAKSSIGFGEELVTQLISFAGLSPTCAAMLLRNVYWLEPEPCTPTDFPFKSGILRMPSFANSSKQPICSPPTIVIGSPASIGMTSAGAKLAVKSTSPRASDMAAGTPASVATKRISVNPSARSSSPQGKEPDCVFGVVVPPLVVGNVVQGLERIIVIDREPAIDHAPRHNRPIADTEVGRHEDCAQHALGRNRIPADEISVSP